MSNITNILENIEIIYNKKQTLDITIDKIKQRQNIKEWCIEKAAVVLDNIDNFEDSIFNKMKEEHPTTEQDKSYIKEERGSVLNGIALYICDKVKRVNNYNPIDDVLLTSTSGNVTRFNEKERKNRESTT